MKTVSIRLADIAKETIRIGYEGELNHTRVVFYCASVFDEHPDATVEMVIQPVRGDKYAQEVTQDGGTLIWDITEDNAAVAGTGRFQFIFTDDGEVFKSGIGSYEVTTALDGNEDVPSLLELVQATATIPTAVASTYTAGQLKKTAIRPTGMINKPIKAIKSVSVTGYPTGIEWSYKIGYDNGGILDLWSHNKTSDSISVPASSVTIAYEFYK
jgi:hypothetical protein